MREQLVTIRSEEAGRRAVVSTCAGASPFRWRLDGPETRNPEPGTPPFANSRAAFSLVELLVVIALVVLIMALALPAFNFISGSRSIDGATNLTAAFLGRARAEALDRGRITGVLFYIDPASQRRGMILVGDTEPNYDAASGASIDNSNIDVFLNLLPDREPILLANGIDVQFIDNGSTDVAERDDRYLGFNTVLVQAPAGTATGPATISQVNYGGVILFDGSGRLVSLRYAFRGTLNPGGSAEPTQMARFLFETPTTPAPTNDFCPPWIAGQPIRSAVGLALLDGELFRNAGGTINDTQIAGATVRPAADEIGGEESWLDENATPLLINRYNGTLVRGQ